MENFATADLLDQFPETEVLLPGLSTFGGKPCFYGQACLLYTSDAADE